MAKFDIGVRATDHDPESSELGNGLDVVTHHRNYSDVTSVKAKLLLNLLCQTNTQQKLHHSDWQLDQMIHCRTKYTVDLQNV